MLSGQRITFIPVGLVTRITLKIVIISVALHFNKPYIEHSWLRDNIDNTLSKDTEVIIIQAVNPGIIQIQSLLTLTYRILQHSNNI